jgi:hypothetical protein
MPMHKSNKEGEGLKKEGKQTKVRLLLEIVYMLVFERVMKKRNNQNKGE